MLLLSMLRKQDTHVQYTVCATAIFVFHRIMYTETSSDFILGNHHIDLCTDRGMTFMLFVFALVAR